QTPWKIPRVTILWFPVEAIEPPGLVCVHLIVGQKTANADLYFIVSPRRHSCIVEVPGAFPRGPAPNRSEVRKMETLTLLFPMPQIVGPAHHHHPRVVSE